MIGPRKLRHSSTHRNPPPPSNRTQQPAPQPGPSNTNAQATQPPAQKQQKIAPKVPAQPPSECVISFVLDLRRVLCLMRVTHCRPAKQTFKFVEYVLTPLLITFFLIFPSSEGANTLGMPPRSASSLGSRRPLHTGISSHMIVFVFALALIRRFPAFVLRALSYHIATPLI